MKTPLLLCVHVFISLSFCFSQQLPEVYCTTFGGFLSISSNSNGARISSSSELEAFLSTNRTLVTELFVESTSPLVESLFASLRSHPIDTISLSKSRFTEVGYCALLLSNNYSIQRLNLDFSRIPNRTLTEVIFRNLGHLVSLDISGTEVFEKDAPLLLRLSAPKYIGISSTVLDRKWFLEKLKKQYPECQIASFNAVK